MTRWREGVRGCCVTRRQLWLSRHSPVTHPPASALMATSATATAPFPHLLDHWPLAHGHTGSTKLLHYSDDRTHPGSCSLSHSQKHDTARGLLHGGSVGRLLGLRVRLAVARVSCALVSHAVPAVLPASTPLSSSHKHDTPCQGHGPVSTLARSCHRNNRTCRATSVRHSSCGGRPGHSLPASPPARATPAVARAQPGCRCGGRRRGHACSVSVEFTSSA